MTNSERAANLLQQANLVAPEMRNALAAGAWNLASRRAQEVVELVIKALMNEMGAEVPRLHDAVPTFVEALRARGVHVDPAFLDWLARLSAWLADLRAPAFYQEIAVEESRARTAVGDAARVLAFGRDLVTKLRGGHG